MEFQNKVDFEFYNNIFQPIIIVNRLNEIIYCNEIALKFLGIHEFNIIENENINKIINFSTLKNNIFDRNDFIESDIFENINLNIDITCNYDRDITYNYNRDRKVDIELVVKGIIIDGDEATLLLFKNVGNKMDKFRNIAPSEGAKSEDEFTGFKYIRIDEEYNDSNELVLNLNLYKTIFATSSSGIVIEKENKICYLNKSARVITGDYSDETIRGKSLFELVKIEELEHGNDFLKNQYSKYDSYLNIIERKLTRQDGSIVYCEITPMCFIENGKVCSVFLLRDITRRLKVEEAIIRNRENYVALLKFLPIGVLIYTDNEFDIMNEAQEKILGLDKINEINDLTISDIVDEEFQNMTKDMYYDAYFRNKSTEFREIKINKKNGSKIDVEFASVGIDFNDGKSVVFLTHEITGRKKAELNKMQLEQAIKYDRLKTEFISNMSHELKTPLNIILSTVQVLQYNYKENKDEQLSNYLDLMKTNSYRLLRLINNLIDVTRIDVGNLKMKFSNYDIVAIVEDITMDVVEYVESKGMSLIFDTDIEEKIVGIDKENIERVMLNLLSNAVKFSKDKGIIMVNIYDLDDKVKISVKDNGIGIADDMQEKIFDKFVQSESLFTRCHEGSGIGLSLVKSIVENHGGKIFVNSVLGGGSEFIVELPSIKSKNKIDSPEIYNVNKNNVERIKIEFADIYK